mmetsp:Transcript_2804/g.5925  ORF Transcript_2804/g.5925 Transcript_2804/m.5925 type:complete len:233 (+) Transcript_2804:2863-3561(+)
MARRWHSFSSARRSCAARCSGERYESIQSIPVLCCCCCCCCCPFVPVLALVLALVDLLVLSSPSSPPPTPTSSPSPTASSSTTMRSIRSRYFNHATAEHARLSDLPVPVGDSSIMSDALRLLVVIFRFVPLAEVALPHVPVSPFSACSRNLRDWSSASIRWICCGYGVSYGNGTVDPVGYSGSGSGSGAAERRWTTLLSLSSSMVLPNSCLARRLAWKAGSLPTMSCAQEFL